jgi:hypothetical protein
MHRWMLEECGSLILPDDKCGWKTLFTRDVEMVVCTVQSASSLFHLIMNNNNKKSSRDL